MSCIKDNIFNVLKDFKPRQEEYVGVMFMNIYKAICTPYRLYFNSDKVLCYSSGHEPFYQIRKDITTRIATKNLLVRLKNSINTLLVVPVTNNDFLLINDNIVLPFIIPLSIPEDGDINTLYEDVYCQENHIDTVLKVISECFECKDTEDDTTFGIAAIDATNTVYTTWYNYTPKKIDIDANYNDDFKMPYNKICDLIQKHDSTALILLYGEPGTGKSSVIKSLISEYKDCDFVFIDGTLLMSASPEKLMTYFLENQNTIFILEDCEKVLMSRDKGYNPVINTILNITDGIISDVLGIKLICTFNTSLQNIDKALLRKGRLSLKYEFGKLNHEKVSKILGHTVDKDMTLADIYNVEDENDYSKSPAKKIGF